MDYDARAAYMQKRHGQLERRKKAKVTELNTDIDDTQLGAGTSSLVKRREMLTKIGDLQKSGKLKKSSVGYFIDDADGEQSALLNDKVFINTLNTVNAHTSELQKQLKEQKEAELAKQQQVQATQQNSPNGEIQLTDQQAVEQGQNVKPTGSISDQIWDHIKAQDVRKKARYGLLAADIGSTAVSYVPGGNFVGAAVGVTSTLGNAYLDFTDEDIDTPSALRNLSIGVGLDLATIFGGKGFKTANSIAKMSPLLKTVSPILKTFVAGYGAYGSYQAINGMSKQRMIELFDRDMSKWTTEDYINAGAVLQVALSTTGNMSRRVASTVRGKNAGPSYLSRQENKMGAIGEHAVARGTGNVSQLDLDKGVANVNAYNKKAATNIKASNRSNKHFEGVSKAYDENLIKKNKFNDEYNKIKDLTPEITDQNKRSFDNAVKARVNVGKVERRFNAKRDQANVNVSNAKAKAGAAHSNAEVRFQNAVMDLDNYRQGYTRGRKSNKHKAAEAEVLKAESLVAKGKNRVDRVAAAEQKISADNIVAEAKVKASKARLDANLKLAKKKPRKNVEAEKVNAKKKVDSAEAFEEKWGKYVKGAGEKKSKAAVKEAESIKKMNVEKDNLVAAKEARKGDAPKRTLKKLEKEARQIGIEAKSSARDLKLNRKKLKQVHDSIDASDTTAKKAAEKELKNIDKKIKSNKKSYDDRIKRKEKELSDEKATWRKYDRAITSTAGKVGQWSIEKIGNLAAGATPTGSNMTHMKLIARAETEKKRKKKADNRGVITAVEKSIEYTKNKQAKLRKKEKELRAKKKKQVEKKEIGGRLIRKFQGGAGDGDVKAVGTGRYGELNMDSDALKTVSGWLQTGMNFLKTNSKSGIQSIKDTYNRANSNYAAPNQYEEGQTPLTDEELDRAMEQLHVANNPEYKDYKDEGSWSDWGKTFVNNVGTTFGNVDEDKSKEILNMLKGQSPEVIAKFRKKYKNKYGTDVLDNVLDNNNGMLQDITDQTNYEVDGLTRSLFPELSEEEKAELDVPEVIDDNGGNGNGGNGGNGNGGNDVKLDEIPLDPKEIVTTEEPEVEVDTLDSEIEQYNEAVTADYKDWSTFSPDSGGRFGEALGGMFSKLNMGDLYNLGQMFKKPKEFKANFTPMQSTTLSGPTISNMDGYQEMKAEASKPAVNMKTNDLMAKTVMERRNNAIKNQKMNKLNAANAAHVSKREDQALEIKNKNRLIGQQTLAQNTKDKNVRSLQNKQLAMQADAQREKDKAQFWGSAGIRLNQGIEEAAADKSRNKYLDMRGVNQDYNSYMTNRQNTIKNSRAEEQTKLGTEYDNLVAEGKLEGVDRDYYISKQTNAGAEWNMSDEDLQNKWDSEYTKSSGYDVSGGDFQAKLVRRQSDAINRANRIKKDPKNY
ncbi:MAG: hypothetical protein KAH32_00465 [Chlamydiia bacterium]|nr:hypothetical protein [Chlamydiia bacterium]